MSVTLGRPPAAVGVAGIGASRARGARRIAGLHPLLFLGVAVPTALAVLYYGLIASDRYVSEAAFVVRGTDHHRATGLEMFFQTFGLSRAVDDTNVVQSYLTSRDAMRAVNETIPLREAFGSARADPLSRFPRPWRTDSDESLYDYYRERVSVIQNASKGITTLTVQAFDPAQAQSIARELMRLGEAMVNRVNARAQDDAVRYADADLEAARARLIAAQKDLTEFRTRELLIDPTSSSASALETVTALSTDLAHASTELTEAEANTGASPALPSLLGKVGALKERIAEERAKIAGDGDALAPRVAAYEGLNLARQMAERSLASADGALDTARQAARQQQIYIERVVSPQRPDDSAEPQRLRMILTVLVLSFALTAVVWILTVGAREHAIE